MRGAGFLSLDPKLALTTSQFNDITKQAHLFTLLLQVNKGQPTILFFVIRTVIKSAIKHIT